MSKKISMKEKKRWLDMFESGKTESQIGKMERRDQRTIARGIQEAIQARRITNIEDDMLRKAIFDHQVQLREVLKEVSNVLVMPPNNLELREGSDGALSDVPVDGGVVKVLSGEEMDLQLEVEKKLSYELLQEHLKHEKIWDYLKRWRSSLIEFIIAENRFKIAIRTRLKEERLVLKQENIKGEDDYILPSLIDLLFGVAANKVLNVPDGTNLEEGIVNDEGGFIRHGRVGSELGHSVNAPECRDKIVSVFTSLTKTPEANELSNSYRKLAEIQKMVSREVEELLLLNMVTGRCRVCRRLGR